LAERQADMIVTMYFKEEGHEVEHMVECDTIRKIKRGDSIELGMYKDNKLIIRPIFREDAKIYIMESGKTVDKIEFMKKK